MERLEGMDTVWSWEAQETTEAEFSYEITLYSGKLKVVLIDPEGALTTLAECDSPGEQNAKESISLEKGESRIKLVAGDRMAGNRTKAAPCTDRHSSLCCHCSYGNGNHLLFHPFHREYLSPLGKQDSARSSTLRSRHVGQPFGHL